MMMQTKEHQQPFFKPLAKENSTSTGSLNRTSQGVITRNNDLDALQSSSMQNQDSNGNGERLISLHAKLHQEADKIRKWKNQTEIELKQKDWKIQEAIQTSESLRKSILELQLQNESLSLKLQEEMNSREEVLQRLTATRDLINLLKDYSAKTEERLLQCETERTELKYLEKKHIKSFEDLSEKFRNLEISAEEDHNKLSKELNTEFQEKNKIKLEWELKFAEAEGQHRALMENCDEKDIEIRDIRTELQKDSEKMHTMGLAIDDLDKQLITCQEEIDKTNFQLSELNQELEDKKGQCLAAEKAIQEKEKEIEDYVTQRLEMRRKFKEAQETSEQRISGLEEDLKSRHNELMEYKDRLQETENYLEKAQALIEEVKSSKVMLLVEKTDIENQLIEVKMQKGELLIQQDENCMKLVEMSKENMELKSQLAGNNEKIEIVKNQLQVLTEKLAAAGNEKQSIFEEIRSLQNRLSLRERDFNNLNSHLSEKCEEVKVQAEKMAQITDEFEKERYEHNMTQLELEKSRDNFSRLETNLKENRHDIIQLEQQLKASAETYENLQKELENKILSEEQLRETISQLEQKIEEQNVELANLQEEKLENDKSLQIELQSKSEVAVNLETKINSLKNEITAKNKQIKELEKEIKSLKSLNKSKDKTAEGLEKEINSLTESLEEESAKRNKLDKRIGEMEAEIRSEMEKANTATENAKSMKMLADDCVRKKEETIHNCDCQIAEMMSTLEKYKKESEKILAQKEKEINTLKCKFNDSKSSKKQEEERTLILQNEANELKRHLEEAKINMNDLKEKFKERDEVMWCLQKENREKHEEIAKLQKNLVDLQIYKSQQSSTAVQTSPKCDLVETTSKPPSINQPKPQPRTPLISYTTEARTPISAMKTPQRSSLKTTTSTNSAMKKRKVFFSKENESNSGGESSSLELMEVEEDEIESRMMGKKANTPLLFRPSPCIRTEEVKPPGTVGDSKPVKCFTSQIPRSLPVEMEKENIQDTGGNLRKTPSRTTGKFFKSSPKDRMKKEKEDLSWFEMDSVFGFGPED